SITYASEKAIESYFHIFYLLCIACKDPDIVIFSNELLVNFEEGKIDKDHSNLGLFLIATLFSDVDTSPKIIQNLITKAITRNTIRILEKHPELAYIKLTAVSDYRLKKTFEAPKTSYRILMVLHIFRRTAIGTPKKSIQQLRDNAFAR
ncbi:hypothetical protein DL98DRAFT_610686, partial [Cadophora sp. DSE1049]